MHSTDPKNEIFPKNKSPSVLSHTFITCSTTVGGCAEANPSRPTPSLNITCLPSCLDTHRLCCAAAVAVVARRLSAFLSAGVDQSVSWSFLGIQQLACWGLILVVKIIDQTSCTRLIRGFAVFVADISAYYAVAAAAG